MLIIASPKGTGMDIVGVTAAIIEKDGKILLGQRPSTGRHALRWEFPGGKVEPGESPGECLAREMAEEMGIEVAVGKKLSEIEHAYSDMKIRLIAFSCEITRGDLQNIGCAAHAWAFPSELGDYDLLPPDRELASVLFG
jgi:8-oxo-dGTP diphosphatase